MAPYPLTQFPWAQTLSTSIEITATIHNLILLFIHIYQTHGKSKIILKIKYLSIWCIFTSFIAGCLFLMLSFSLQPRFISCKYVADIASSEYLLYKVSYSLLWLETLYTSFNKSIYSFRPHTIYSSRIALAMWYFFQVLLIFISGKGYYIPEYDICSINYPLYTHTILSLGDLVIGVWITVMFCRRLMTVTISLNSSEMDKTEQQSPQSAQNRQQNNILDTIMRNEKLYNLLIKITLLAVIAILSTVTSIILVGIFEIGAFFIMIDTMIDVWCAMLLFACNDRLYNVICGEIRACVVGIGCVKICSCTYCCKIKIEKKPKIQIEMSNSKSTKIDSIPIP
eukprot:275462_1